MITAIESYDQFFSYKYNVQFRALKARIKSQYNVPSWNSYKDLLIRAVKNPRKAYVKIRTLASIVHAELTNAVSAKNDQIAELTNAVSAKNDQIAELTNAVSAKNDQIAELTNAVSAKHDQIAELTNAIFINTAIAPAFLRKLQLGCGDVKLSGWLNIDIKSNADLVVDVRKGLPFDDNSVDFIYSEHLHEHLTYQEGERLLSECHRCLKKHGVMRVATPDLDYVIQKYGSDWKDQDWLTWSGFQDIETRGMMLNIGLRSWGHQYLYNEEDLRKQLVKAGFKCIIRCQWNSSKHTELIGLETRKDSTLIIEAGKGV
jgi:predicted SAM-dependent methyltransferase